MNIPNGGFPPLIVCYDNIKQEDLNKMLKNKKNSVLNMKNIINNKKDIIIKYNKNEDELDEV